jgi:ABC-type dipeptide/oligopeptide/nickel transport system permease component
VARYLARRLLLTVPVLLGVATLVFALIHLVPGDPAQAMLGETASAEEIGRWRFLLPSRSGSSPPCSADAFPITRR